MATQHATRAIRESVQPLRRAAFESAASRHIESLGLETILRPSPPAIQRLRSLDVGPSWPSSSRSHLLLNLPPPPTVRRISSLDSSVFPFTPPNLLGMPPLELPRCVELKQSQKTAPLTTLTKPPVMPFTSSATPLHHATPPGPAAPPQAIGFEDLPSDSFESLLQGVPRSKVLQLRAVNKVLRNTVANSVRYFSVQPGMSSTALRALPLAFPATNHLQLGGAGFQIPLLRSMFGGFGFAQKKCLAADSQEDFTAMVEKMRFLRCLRLAKLSGGDAASYMDAVPRDSLQALHTLELTECSNLEDDVCKGLHEVQLPHLRTLRVIHCDLSKEAFHFLLSAAPNLEHFVVHRCENFTDETLTQAEALCPRLQVIHLKECQNSSTEGMVMVGKARRDHYGASGLKVVCGTAGWHPIESLLKIMQKYVSE